MGVQRYHSAGLAVLSSALALLCGNVSAYSSFDCMPMYISDGLCDEFNNNVDCSYDGGDCCRCTCVDRNFDCGENNDFTCRDPSASCFEDNSTTSDISKCESNFFADGDCDLQNNKEECGYDGGDCCQCTCVDTDTFNCGDEEFGGFACLDPSAPCVDDDDITTLPDYDSYPSDTPSTNTDTTTTTTTTTGPCIPDFMSDGDCDLDNNIKECRYDGGDCCECTCVDTDAFTCGLRSHGGFTCLDPSAPCVDDDDATVNPTSEETDYSIPTTTGSPCVPDFASDGDCDVVNNTEECGYDGGDCCACTCVSSIEFTCGDEDNGGFACIDPSAPCVDDDDFTMTQDDFYMGYDDDFSASFTFEPCMVEFIGDGDCDSSNNSEECGFDGGDCCECTCVSTEPFTCGLSGFDCVDPSSSCDSSDYVEAGTKTTVDVSANAYDTRPGLAVGDVGCGEDGCGPVLTRDGVSDDAESRWSCSQKIVPDGGLCEIEFTFADAQDIADVQVAFWNGDVRSRRLEATVNGEFIGQFDSQPGATFTSLGIEGTGVHTLMLKTVGLGENEWISLTEVLFLVEP